MSNCEKYFDMLNMLADGELPETQREELMAHLDTCPNCRNIYEGIMLISETMQEPEEAPEGLHEKIMASVKAEKRRKTVHRYMPMVGTLAACLVVFIGAGTVLFAPKSSSQATAQSGAVMEVPMAPAMAAADAGAEEAYEMPMANFAAEAPAEMQKSDSASLEIIAAEEPGESNSDAILKDILENAETMEGEETELPFDDVIVTVSVREGRVYCEIDGNETEIHTIEEIHTLLEAEK